jgi:tetratricopeptide (TPR) repeat protein
MHRMRAFALAARGRCDDALAELNRGWGEDWPDPAAYAADVARVRLAVGHHEEALEALRLAVRGAPHIDRRVPALAADCVRKSPGLWRRALRLAFEGGSAADRARLSFAVARARL